MGRNNGGTGRIFPDETWEDYTRLCVAAVEAFIRFMNFIEHLAVLQVDLKAEQRRIGGNDDVR